MRLDLAAIKAEILAQVEEEREIVWKEEPAVDAKLKKRRLNHQLRVPESVIKKNYPWAF